ncbi:YjdF family protein [Streptococcus dentapri]|uniref:YjdF family protein n=1 Tax=Streptococcus dentapri TaxID=573564 RepID=A0ABV8D3L1_9STRE
MQMTVYFDGAFWSALIEYNEPKQGYQAFRYIFGKEPKEAEILQFIYKDLSKWMHKQEKLGVQRNDSVQFQGVRRVNPKRKQREASRAKKKPAISTKAQQVMQESHELLKKERRANQKQKREAYKEEQFLRKQEKRRQKKKGH